MWPPPIDGLFDGLNFALRAGCGAADLSECIACTKRNTHAFFDRVVGISKLARLVNVFGKRLQVQEKMTAQIANVLMEVLRPRGVAVVLEGEHHCMSTRGVHRHGVSMVTSTMLGNFRKDPRTRKEFMDIIGNPTNRM